MIHPIDLQTLQRITGRDNIPKMIEDEYNLRLKMYHSAGESGALGIVGCIDMVRSLGVMIPLDPAKPGEVDWRTVPANGTVLVKVGPFVGQYHRGYYMGMAPGGTLGVKMIEGDYPPGWVLEVRKDMTQIVIQDEEHDLDELDPATEGRRREEELRAAQVREDAEKLRAAKREAEKLERSREWSKEQNEAIDRREAEMQAKIEELEAKLKARPAPMVLKAPPPPTKGKKPVKPAPKAKTKAKPAPKPAPDEPPRDENGDIIYKEYIPPAEDTPALRANLDLIKALEPETPVYVAVGEGDETEVMDAVYKSTTANDLVEVLVDGEEQSRVVPATAITLLT